MLVRNDEMLGSNTVAIVPCLVNVIISEVNTPCFAFHNYERVRGIRGARFVHNDVCSTSRVLPDRDLCLDGRQGIAVVLD